MKQRRSGQEDGRGTSGMGYLCVSGVTWDKTYNA